MKKTMKHFLLSNEQRYVLLSGAKLRRESEEDKKTAEIFMKLLRQSPDFATKQDNCADSCPKRAADNLFFQR